MSEVPPKKKRRPSVSLKQRSVLMLRRQGFDTADVERRIPRSFVTVDLFNFADLVAIRADVPGVLAIQSTSTSNQAARVKKIIAEPRALTWLRAGNRIEVHGWLKSKRTRRWECTVTEIKASDFDEDVLQLNRNEGEADAVTDELRRKAPEDGQNNGKEE